ncbi:hypothetical protein J6590_028577 [Homalodisca vitripennis]|nr:hypothetical protein J6590_028577 [Homalodisca vitripennis]
MIEEAETVKDPAEETGQVGSLEAQAAAVVVEVFETEESEDDFFWGKDGSVWCRKEPPKQRRIPQHNIMRGPLPGPTARARVLGNNPLITRFEFIKRLTLKLIKPHMTRRLEIQSLPKDIRRVITEYVGETESANPNECVPSDKLEKTEDMFQCPVAKERKTNYKCIKCGQPICLECSRKLCIP